MTKYYLNYAPHLGIHELSFHNSGYCCDNIIEFFEEIITGNDCNVARYDLKDMLNALEDGSFLAAIGMDETIAEMLHDDIKEIMEENMKMEKYIEDEKIDGKLADALLEWDMPKIPLSMRT